jgi:transposase-like protein
VAVKLLQKCAVKGLQRYKCKDCVYHYTVEQKSDVKSGEIRRLALEMYLEGISLLSVGTGQQKRDYNCEIKSKG